MFKISENTIEIIADSIAQYIKQGRLLKRDARGGDGWQSKENLEVLWHDYIKRVDPYEKKYIIIINSMLTKQAKEVFDKIKRYPNNYKKWMFDRKKWLNEFAEAEAKFIVKLYKQEGQKAIDLALKLSRKSYYKVEDIPISITFDAYNPEVTEALVAQTTRFPAGVVGTSEEIIRREIANGLELGESIGKLRKRVTERLGPTFIKNRAEMIARSETIYASNAGAELGYMQSGVVEGKKWLTAVDERTCDPCIDMNNMTAPLGQPTWEKEGLNIGDVQGKYGLDFDYTEGAMPHPPLHPRCRCTITPIVKAVTKKPPRRVTEDVLRKNKVISKTTEGYRRGINNSMKIEIEDGGTAIFKTRGGELPGLIERMGGNGTECARERAVYILSREMGIDNVPITVLRNVDDVFGSVQQWIEKTKATVFRSLEPGDYSTYMKANYYRENAKMTMWDTLIGNVDRNAGNYLVGDKMLHYIDNGWSMPSKGALYGSFNRFQIDAKARVEDTFRLLGKSEMTKIKTGLEKVTLSKKLEKEMKGLGLGSEWIYLLDRANFMIKLIKLGL